MTMKKTTPCMMHEVAKVQGGSANKCASPAGYEGGHRRVHLKWDRPNLFTRFGLSRNAVFSPPVQTTSLQFTGSKLPAVPLPSLN